MTRTHDERQHDQKGTGSAAEDDAEQLQQPSPQVRRETLKTLEALGPIAAHAQKEVLAAMRNASHATFGDSCADAAQALMAIGYPSDSMSRELIDMMQCNRCIRPAVDMLGRLGPSAAMAVPVLEETGTTHVNPEIREAANWSLHQIKDALADGAGPVGTEP